MLFFGVVYWGYILLKISEFKLDWNIFGYSVILFFIVWLFLFMNFVLGLIILCFGFVVVLWKDLKISCFFLWYIVLRKVFLILAVILVGLIVVVLYF